MNHPRILLSTPHMSGLEQEHIAEAFRTNWIAPLGPHVDEFEKEFAGKVEGLCRSFAAPMESPSG